MMFIRVDWPWTWSYDLVICGWARGLGSIQACIQSLDSWVLYQGQGQMTLNEVTWHLPCEIWHKQGQLMWHWQWPLTLTLVTCLWKRLARQQAKTRSIILMLFGKNFEHWPQTISWCLYVSGSGAPQEGKLRRQRTFEGEFLKKIFFYFFCLFYIFFIQPTGLNTQR